MKRLLPVTAGLALACLALIFWMPGDGATLPRQPVGSAVGSENQVARGRAAGGGSWEALPFARTSVESDAPHPPPGEVGDPARPAPRLVVRVSSIGDGAVSGEVRVSPNRGPSVRRPLVDGVAQFALDPASVRTVLVTAPGHLRLSRRFDPGSCGPELDLALPLAGRLRVLLVDTSGHRLSGRYVETHAVQRSPLVPVPADEKVVYLARGGAETGEAGVAVIDHVMPGTHVVSSEDFAWWRACKSSEVQVAAGVTSDVSITVPTRDSTTFAGVSFPLAALPDIEEPDDVLSWRLFAGERNASRIFVVGDRCVAMVVADPGAEVSAFVAESRDRRRVLAGGRRSEPFVMTVGAVVNVELLWQP